MICLVDPFEHRPLLVLLMKVFLIDVFTCMAVTNSAGNPYQFPSARSVQVSVATNSRWQSFKRSEKIRANEALKERWVLAKRVPSRRVRAHALAEGALQQPLKSQFT